MKNWIPIIVLIGIFGLIGASAQKSGGEKNGGAASDTANMEKQLRIQVEWIELTHEDFTALMENADSLDAKALKSSNDGPLRSKLKKMIEEEDAEIIDTAVVMARSGQRAKVESIREMIYPTEYIPARSVEQDEAEPESDEEEDDETNGHGAVLPTPSKFETRNVGTTLEVDPVLGADERTIDLSLSPEIVYHAGYEDYGVYVEEESEVVAKMPIFYTMKVTTQVTVIDGEYCFVGVQSPLDMEDDRSAREQKVMVFIKADVVYVGLPVKGAK
jgi:Flp pilus assembly secretin CpaC